VPTATVINNFELDLRCASWRVEMRFSTGRAKLRKNLTHLLHSQGREFSTF